MHYPTREGRADALSYKGGESGCAILQGRGELMRYPTVHSGTDYCARVSRDIYDTSGQIAEAGCNVLAAQVTL